MTYNQLILRIGLTCGVLYAVLVACEWAMAANC